MIFETRDKSQNDASTFANRELVLLLVLGVVAVSIMGVAAGHTVRSYHDRDPSSPRLVCVHGMCGYSYR